MIAKIRQRFTGIRNRAQIQTGLGLVETLVGVAILGTSVVAFVTALSAGSIAVAEQDEAVATQNLAQNQMEYTKSYPYDTEAITYPAIDAPEGYSVSVAVTSVPDTDDNIQRITVTVSRGSEPVITLADYKMNR